ncbi:MAG: FAD-dependent oxidoreductase [Promethearchaeota archaeon]|jgi:protoporphyrinogen oxidase
MRVGIIGGGLSGLVCAYRLQKAGIPSLLFEKEASLGGRVKTEIVNGVSINIGAQVFSRAYKNLINLISELGLKGSVKKLSTDEIIIFSNGKTYTPNTKGLMSSGLFSRAEILRIPTLFLNKDYPELTIPPDKAVFKKFHNTSWRDYLVKKKFPVTVIDNLIDPLAKLITSRDSSKVSAAHGIFLGLELMKPPTVLEGGLGKLIECLELKIRKNVEILTSSRVERIEPHNLKFIVTYNQKGTNRNKELDIIVSSIPIPEAKELFPELLNLDMEYASITQLTVEGQKHSVFQKAHIIVPNIYNNSILFCVGKREVSSVFTEDENYDLNVIFRKHQVIKKVIHKYAHPIIQPNQTIPCLFCDTRNIYLCGDYYYYPSLETAVVTGHMVAEKIAALLEGK